MGDVQENDERVCQGCWEVGESMAEEYFEMAYWRDFILPAIFAGICLVALIIYVVAHYASLIAGAVKKKLDDKKENNSGGRR